MRERASNLPLLRAIECSMKLVEIYIYMLHRLWKIADFTKKAEFCRFYKIGAAFACFSKFNKTSRKLHILHNLQSIFAEYRKFAEYSIVRPVMVKTCIGYG